MLWLIRFSGDLTTKYKQTRKRFQARLNANLRDALDSNAVDYRLNTEWSRFYLESDDPHVETLLGRVFGVQSYSPVQRRPLTTLDALVSQGAALYREAVRGRRYAVRARRAGQGAPFGSMDVQVALGAALNAGATVDLSDPEIEVHVEVRADQVYFFSEQLPGPGGLPLGVEGRALALLSGGFDSAVAAWMLLKRGVALDYIFFRLGGQAHERDVARVVEVLARDWSHGTHPKLHVIPFEDVIAQIQDRVHTRYWQLVLKRQMYRAARLLARERGLHALVTGEALGQVSSQTLKNLEALSITGDLPLLRPLLGFDKNEIIARADRIGTGAVSAGVPEYCAIVSKRPATGANARELDEQEAKLEADLAAKVAAAKRVDLRSERLRAPAREAVRTLPHDPDAVLLDIRTRGEFQRDHDPRAHHLEFSYALDYFDRLDPQKAYYVYCGVGLKSANLVERMRAAGYRAHVYQPEYEKIDV